MAAAAAGLAIQDGASSHIYLRPSDLTSVSSILADRLSVEPAAAALAAAAAADDRRLHRRVRRGARRTKMAADCGRWTKWMYATTWTRTLRQLLAALSRRCSTEVGEMASLAPSVPRDRNKGTRTDHIRPTVWCV